MAATKSEDLSAGEMLLAVTLSLPALFVIIYLLFFRDFSLAPSLAMHLQAARLLLAGQTPYTDFWDWSPPVVFALHAVPLELEKVLGGSLGTTVLTKLSIWFCLLASLALSLVVLSRGCRRLVAPLAVGLACANLAVCSQFGTLQHLFLLAVIPWLLMRCLAYEGIKISLPLQALVALAAALGCNLDFPNLFVLFCCECSLLISYGTAKKILSWQMLIFALALAAIFGLFLNNSIWQGYLQWTLPLRLAKYGFFDSALKGISYPDNTRVFYLFAFAQLLAFYCSRKSERLGSITSVLATLSLSGLALFVAEGEGLSSDLVIASFATVLLLVYTVMIVDWQKIWQEKFFNKSGKILPLFLAVLFPLSISFFFEDNCAASKKTEVIGSAKMNDLILKLSGKDDFVTIISQYPSVAFPRLTSLERQPSGYLLWARPLRMLKDLQYSHALNEHQFSFQAHMVGKLSQELTGRKAALILLEPGQSQLLAFYRLEPLLTANYKQSGFCQVFAEPYGLTNYSLWQRK